MMKAILRVGSRSGSHAKLSCTICHETINAVRPDGSTETQYSLPCSHVFGSICILRWLHNSTHQDCPICRRQMIHPGCGHLIMPHETTTAPPSIPETETPAQCIRCRGDSALALVLKRAQERVQAQEAALRGMQVHIPSLFSRAFAARSIGGVDERIAELRKGFAGFHERAWSEFAEKERRERW
jgi:hypothetical protein